MCLAQGHNAVMLVRLGPAAPRSRVKHSTTEPLCSLDIYQCHILSKYLKSFGSYEAHKHLSTEEQANGYQADCFIPHLVGQGIHSAL